MKSFQTKQMEKMSNRKRLTDLNITKMNFLETPHITFIRFIKQKKKTN